MDVVIGVLAVAIGALFCFRGYVAMRIIIPIWGAFVGFMLGAGIAASIENQGFLTTVLGWILGLVLAVVIAALAYLYYEVSVAIVLGGIGFVLGTGLMAALGVTWSWVVVPVGVALGLLLAVIAIMADLPAILLVVLTALGGAATIVGGVMLLVGTVDLDELDRETTERLDLGGWWYALQIGLAIAGIVAQSRDAARRQRLEQAWRRSDWRA
jgi:hypothetical protein